MALNMYRTLESYDEPRNDFTTPRLNKLTEKRSRKRRGLGGDTWSQTTVRHPAISISIRALLLASDGLHDSRSTTSRGYKY